MEEDTEEVMVRLRVGMEVMEGQAPVDMVSLLCSNTDAISKRERREREG
jgi:hypothetical protein